jgi:O-antigen/teichoic acid export membrane protein
LRKEVKSPFLPIHKLSTRRALFLSLAQRYVGLTIYIVSTMILARLLKPEEIGIFSLCAAVTAIAGTLRDFGISEYIIQERELTRDRLRAAYGLAIVTAWTLALIVFLLRSPLAAYYGEPGLRVVLAVLTLNFLLLPLASPAFAVLTREMKFSAIFVIQTAAALTQAVTSIALAWRGFSYMSLAWAGVAANVVQIFGTAFFRPREAWLLPGFKEWKRVWSYGSRVSGATLLHEISRNAYEFIIAKQLGFAALGLYNRAIGLMSQFHQNITSAILRVAHPSFAATSRAGRDMVPEYTRALAYFTGVAWPFFAFVAVMSREVIEVLFGHQWLEAAPLARILAVSSMIYSTWALAPSLLAALGEARRKLRIQLFLTPAAIGITVLASLHSLEAVAYGAVISSVIALMLHGDQLRQVIGLRVMHVLYACGASAKVTLVCFAIAVAASKLVAVLLVNPLLQVLWVGCWVGVGWIGGLFLFSHPLRTELSTVWSSVRRYRLLGVGRDEPDK